jgi:hypothetical protein
MGTVDLRLASDLVATVGLKRAVETGTYRGRTARSLASVFQAVVTIELSAELHEQAVGALRDVPSITPLLGHSAQVLRDVSEPATPTLFYLDGHWSGGVTAGEEDECPVLEELAAIGSGHEDDCVVIDDARLFTSAPPPPHERDAWPLLIDVFDAIRARRPDHIVTVLADQVIAVPRRARTPVDDYGQRVASAQTTMLTRVKGAAYQTRELVRRRR